MLVEEICAWVPVLLEVHSSWSTDPPPTRQNAGAEAPEHRNEIVV